MIIKDFSQDSLVYQLEGIDLYAPLFWTCGKCGENHQETESRNLIRRQVKCNCVLLEKSIIERNLALEEHNYTLLDYSLSKTKRAIDCKKPMIVQCNSCKKIFTSYYYNIIKGWKKCDCNEIKKFTRDLTKQDFIAKWTGYNQNKFTLINDNYNGRNYKYLVTCNNCGFQQYKWGITLISKDCTCLKCDGSLGEQKVCSYLDGKDIFYIREYRTIINNHVHFFDFFIPSLKIFVEVNGDQHYKPVSFFGGEKEFKKRQERDIEKENYCKDQNSTLIIINKEDKIEEKLKLN